MRSTPMPATASAACPGASCRPGIHAARVLYAEIGHQVARQGLDSVTARAVVPPGRKLWVLLRSLAPARPIGAEAPQTLDAVRFLVDAASSPGRPAAQKSLDDRIAWLVDLFARLDERRQVEL